MKRKLLKFPLKITYFILQITRFEKIAKDLFSQKDFYHSNEYKMLQEKGMSEIQDF